MPFPEAFPVLATARLVLRPLREDDVPALFAILSDPETMRYWATPPWTSPAQGVGLIARAREGFARKEALRWAVTEVDGGSVIGSATLFGIDATHLRAEVGYILARDRWGRGLMREALAAVLDFAFGPLGLHRVEADVDPRNAASLGLLERLGFAREGYLRERWRVNGEVCDSVFLGLLAPEAVRAR
jgi:ribosomal-protein-alanine N-acetyltransferase